MKLTEYLNPETLQQLQDAFAAISQVPIRIRDASGEPLTSFSCPVGSEAGDAAMEECVAGVDRTEASAPIMVNDEIIGRVTLEASHQSESPRAVYPRHLRLLGLAAGVIARLSQRERQLRTRVDELATLYRLTAEFNSHRDLQDLLDLVARTVVEAMNAKACSLRLLSDDGTELLIKSVANLSPEYLNKGPILLSESQIDQEVLSTGNAVYIADERSDRRVLYPDEARQEGIVSGLCAAMMYKGRPEGVIRVYTAEPYEFDWFEVSLLKAIAAEAAAAIVNARLYGETVRAANMHRQLRLAGEVQRRMIPSKPPELSGFDIAAIYVPCFELGGDFYDFISLPSDNLGVAVCDVVGKGVRASLLMASIRAALRAHAANIYDMSDVLRQVNRDLCADTLSSDFATMFYGVIDGQKRLFTYANAGHTPPLLIRGQDVRYLNCGGGVLGIDTSLTWRQEAIALQSGDMILMYTDGLNEAMNFEDESFGRHRVEQAALAAIGQVHSAEGIAKHVLWEMRRFAGLQTRLDDLTLIAIQVL